MKDKDKKRPTPERVGALTYHGIIERIRRNPSYKDIECSFNHAALVEHIRRNWLRYMVLYTMWIDNNYCWGLRPSIDRIDTYSGYTLDNIQFIPMKENSKKRKTNILYKGETATEASYRLGGNRHLVKTRIRDGWERKKAFCSPLNKRLNNLKHINQ